MAGERTLPGIGLKGFWTPASNNWHTENDPNLRKLSVLVQGSAISRTSTLPASPTNGDIYIVPAGAGSNPNQIAVRDNGAWVYYVPLEGWRFWVKDDNDLVIFNGSAWEVFEAGGGSGGAGVGLGLARWTPPTGTWTLDGEESPEGATETGYEDGSHVLLKVQGGNEHWTYLTDFDGSDGFDVVARLVCSYPDDDYAAPYFAIGVGTKVIQVGPTWNGRWMIKRHNAHVFGTEAFVDAHRPPYGGYYYMRAVRSGGDISFYHSWDGLTWQFLLTETVSNYLGADPTTIGISVETGSVSSTKSVMVKLIGLDLDGPQAEITTSSGGGGGGLEDAPSDDKTYGRKNGEWVDVNSVYAYSPFNEMSNITPTIGGGMILRNPDYTGPAIRLVNNSTDAEQDIEFDATGRVAGDNPFGADARVIRVYDQWGDDDWIAVKGDGIKVIVNDDTEFFTWQFDFSSAVNGLFTASTGASNPAWEVQEPLWMVGIKRLTTSGLVSIHGADGSPYMSVGLWQENGDLHWRVDGSGGDWPATNYTTDAPEAAAFNAVVGDVTQRNSNGYGYVNGTLKVTQSYAPLIGYPDASRLGFGDKDGLGNPFTGLMTELHYFSSTAATTTDEIAYLSQAGVEVLSEPEVPASGGGGGASAIEDLDGFIVDRETLGPEHNGQGFGWDDTEGAFIVNPPGFDTLKLGGGMEVIYSVANMSGFTTVTLTEASHDIDQFDELVVVFTGADRRLAIELSVDGGTTPQNIFFYQKSNTTTAALLTEFNVGHSTGDNDAGTGGVARITGHSIANSPTFIEGFGGTTAVAGENMTSLGIANAASRTNAVTIFMDGEATAGVGALYVIGVKKSRQPLEYGGKLDSAWSADAEIARFPTMGAKFRSGTVGIVELDVAPGADKDFELQDADGTVIATATVLAAETTATVTAGATATITDEVVLVAVDAAGSASTARMVVRGEVG